MSLAKLAMEIQQHELETAVLSTRLSVQLSLTRYLQALQKVLEHPAPIAQEFLTYCLRLRLTPPKIQNHLNGEIEFIFHRGVFADNLVVYISRHGLSACYPHTSDIAIPQLPDLNTLRNHEVWQEMVAGIKCDVKLDWATLSDTFKQYLPT